MSEASLSSKNEGAESVLSTSLKERVTFDDSQEDRDAASEPCLNNETTSNVFLQRRAYSMMDETNTVASSWAPQRPIGASDAASASMNSTIPSWYNRTRRKQTKDKQSKEERQEHKSNPQAPSLTERLGNSALSSTLEILKLAGGVTLSTTGTILSPSLELTRNFILPNLFAGIAEYLSNVSPQRLKDWFRIFSASIHHLVAVIVSTKRGSIFRRKVVRVGGDIVDVASSDVSRQALMDGMACFVKLNEALHTPEFKAFLEQMGVWGCRIVDAAANGKNKKLIHDVLDLAWSGVELANDPATTVAFAEVAAYLCYALEMEDIGIHSIVKERNEINRTAAQKRHERDEYQAETYQEPYLLNDPNATVEEAILSAFGVIQKSVEEAQLRNAGKFNADDIPGSVVLGPDDDEESEQQPSRAVTPPPTQSSTENVTAGAGSQCNVLYEDIADEKPVGIGQHGVDVGLLREKITKRSENQRQEQVKARPNETTTLKPSKKMPSNRQASEVTDDFDDGEKDVEDLASLVKEEHSKQIHNPALQFEKGNEPQEDVDERIDESRPQIPPSRPDRSMPLEGETPVAHFYRVLDQVLSSQREKAIDSVIPGADLFDVESDKSLHSGELRKRLQQVRSEKRTSKVTNTSDGVYPKIAEYIDENKVVVCTTVLCVVSLLFVFFAFGCYGMYMFAFPPTPSHVAASGDHGFGGSDIHVPVVIHDNLQSRRKDEYVIRVIREVVHVDSKGEVLHVQKHSSEEL